MIGKIVSLALAGILLAGILWFFARKKSPALMAGGAFVWLVYIAMILLDWFFPDQNFSYAVQICAIASIIAGVTTTVIYQSDFKNIFRRLSHFHKKTPDVAVTDEEIRASAQAIVTACQTMAKSRTGALIVVVRDQIDQYILNSGVRLDAIISAPLLESIFNTKCPMHDGAVIVKGNKILTAGSFLPLSKNESLAKDLGTRHRAGIGVTEAEGSEIVSIIISEENGIISTATNGVLRRYLTPERLFDILYDSFNGNFDDHKQKKSKKIFG